MVEYVPMPMPSRPSGQVVLGNVFEVFEVAGDTSNASSGGLGWSCCCQGRGWLSKILIAIVADIIMGTRFSLYLY